MSEKIYACLLRIFPSAFRRRYEEEALRLFRDRHSDERGFSRRLRLCFELLADIIGALPQAYRNSYAEAAPADSLTPHFDGIPSFQVLRSEPIRRGSVVSACVFSLLALAAFVYVMQGPVAYHPVPRNGRTSPIESVMKNLNEPLTADSADNERLYASDSDSNDTAGPLSSTVANTQPAHLSKHAGNDQAPAVAVEASASDKGIRIPAPVSDSLNMQAPAAAAVNLSGVWISTTVSSNAGLPKWFVFEQDGAGFTGTAGPDSTEQYQIVHASATGGSVAFESSHGRKRFLYSLKVEGGELRGTVSIKTGGDVRTGVASLQRVR